MPFPDPTSAFFDRAEAVDRLAGRAPAAPVQARTQLGRPKNLSHLCGFGDRRIARHMSLGRIGFPET